MNSVRVYLALFLAAQFLVPLVPSWGAFVPHAHWARTHITQEDWREHVLDHLTGPTATAVPTADSDETQIVSTWTHDGTSSFHAPLADHDANVEFALAPRAVLATVGARQFTARVLAYPPPNPPPTV